MFLKYRMHLDNFSVNMFLNFNQKCSVVKIKICVLCKIPMCYKRKLVKMYRIIVYFILFAMCNVYFLIHFQNFQIVVFQGLSLVLDFKLWQNINEWNEIKSINF